MIARNTDRVIIQGITGKQGTFWTERMQEYGTQVVAGVNPKKTRHHPLQRAGVCQRKRDNERGAI